MTGKLRYRRFLLLSACTAFAHHAYTAEFDTTKPIKLTGVLTKLEWTNPHIWLYLDVKDENGKVTNWGFSASPPGMLTRRGITKTSLETRRGAHHLRAPRQGWIEQRVREHCHFRRRARRINWTGPGASANRAGSSTGERQVKR